MNLTGRKGKLSCQLETTVVSSIYCRFSAAVYTVRTGTRYSDKHNRGTSPSRCSKGMGFMHMLSMQSKVKWIDGQTQQKVDSIDLWDVLR
jgi:hypothetical protein